VARDRRGHRVRLVAPGPAGEAKWLADAFIQLIQTITGPVIFVTVIGNAVARWSSPSGRGNATRPASKAALRDPSRVEELTDRALHGEDIDDLIEVRTGRFDRDGDRQVASSSIHLPTTGGS
jgi:hypothetical protein